jgi:multiple sugar transport system ATP-binding protein
MRSDAAVKSGDRAPFAFNMDKATFFDPTTEKRVA